MNGVRFLVVSMALLFSAEVPNQDIYTFSDGRQCGLEGDAQSPPGKDLDRHKNRYHPPDPGQIDGQVSLAALLAPGDDVGRFDPEQAATITGLVIDVKVGGKESCNCHEMKPIDRDTHIELALSAQAPEIQRAVVEVTPRLRAQMKSQGVNWTTEALRNPRTGIKGKWVEVTGWMLFDSAHIGEAENTNPGGPQNWRATCWEIHPVTKMRVLDGPPSGMSEFPPALFRELHRTQAQQARRDPKRLERIHQRNQMILSQFKKDELDEDHPR